MYKLYQYWHLKQTTHPPSSQKQQQKKNDPSDTVVPGALGGKNRNCNLVSIFQSES